jgi:DNA polymerase-3 subunit gamma/tau
MPAVAPAEAASPGILDATALRRLWPEVLETVKQSSRRTRALLDNAQITNAVGELVTLAAPSALARMISEDSNTSVLRQALTKVVGGEWRIDVEPANGAASSPAAPAATTGAPAATVAEPPPEPDPRDDADPDDEPGRIKALDPEAEALRLLQDQLGARPVDNV